MKHILSILILVILLAAAGIYALSPQGHLIPVHQGDSLQSAYDSAQPGDTIELDAGAAFQRLNMTGNGKSGTGYITIRSTRYNELPVNSRVSPTDTPKFAKIVTNDTTPALEAAPTYTGTGQLKASHVRFIGIEITLAPGNQTNYGLVKLGGSGSFQTTVEQAPDYLEFDRCYIHGSVGASITRGIALNSAFTTIINSYISDIHGFGFDTQAICGWNGPGPFVIENNYLEASGENVMFGGADPKIPDLVPADISFRRNTCAKPKSWNPNDPAYTGLHWSVKNLFELKNARRVVIDGNLFENCWVDAQTGIAIQITPRNQDGAAPWCTVEDITFTSNIVRHAAAGFNILGTDDSHPSGRASRIRINNVLFDDIGGSLWGGNGRLLQIIAGPTDVTFEHITSRQTAHTIVADVGSSPNFIFRNNISVGGDYGVFGSGASEGNATLSQYFPNALFTRNALVGRNSGLYPAGNYFPSSEGAVGFVNPSTGDFRLSPSSPYKGQATDGKDLGVDMTALNDAQTGINPVQIVSVIVSQISTYGAVIDVTTDQPSIVFIEFGFRTVSAQTRPSPVSTAHHFVLDYFPAGATILYTVVAANSGGAVSSAIQTFKTLSILIERDSQAMTTLIDTDRCDRCKIWIDVQKMFYKEANLLWWEKIAREEE